MLIKERIPSLDGLRAISIFMVVGSHVLRSSGVDLEFRNSKILKFLFNGELGVHIFFVISGFIITLLLLKEERDHKNEFSISKFYLRRVIRIFPTYYIFLIFIGVLGFLEFIPIPKSSFFAALTFTTGLWGEGTWLLGHTWSLAVEEQFYLLWPWFLVFIKSSKKRIILTLLIISLLPLIRVVVYMSLWRVRIPYLFITQADVILFGSLTALCFFYYQVKLEVYIRRSVTLIRLAGGGIILLLFLMGTFQIMGYLLVPFSNTITGLVISLTLLTVILKNDLLFYFLNRKWVVYIGVVSFGWYIWQQFFITDGTHWYNYFPMSVLISLLFAITNHELVEVFFERLKPKKK